MFDVDFTKIILLASPLHQNSSPKSFELSNSSFTVILIEYKSACLSVSLSVCLFPNSSETTKPDELNFEV